jgi:prevent-host-death family protein
VETISISDFKARCLAILKRVKKTGRPVRITCFGEPVAEIVGDIISPVASPQEWEALRR